MATKNKKKNVVEADKAVSVSPGDQAAAAAVASTDNTTVGDGVDTTITDGTPGDVTTIVDGDTLDTTTTTLVDGDTSDLTTGESTDEGETELVTDDTSSKEKSEKEEIDTKKDKTELKEEKEETKKKEEIEEPKEKPQKVKHLSVQFMDQFIDNMKSGRRSTAILSINNMCKHIIKDADDDSMNEIVSRFKEDPTCGPRFIMQNIATLQVRDRQKVEIITTAIAIVAAGGNMKNLNIDKVSQMTGSKHFVSWLAKKAAMVKK